MSRMNKSYISRLKEENEDLKRNLRRAEKLLNLMESMSAHMAEKLMEDNEMLENEADMRKKTADKLRKENEMIRQSLKDYLKIVKNQDKQIEELKAKCEVLTEKIKELEAKSIDNQQELIAAYDLINKLKSENEQLKARRRR